MMLSVILLIKNELFTCFAGLETILDSGESVGFFVKRKSPVSQSGIVNFDIAGTIWEMQWIWKAASSLHQSAEFTCLV